MVRRTPTLLGVLALYAMIGLVPATQAFPNKPVRLVVGFTPGSEIDVIARMLGHELSEKWGQRVVVDNRPGAGGTLAGAIVATAAADGYTLYFNSVAHAASSALYPKLSYHPLQDFAAVSQATSAPNVLVVGPGVGIKTLKELVAMARQKPGYVNFGSAGVGSGTHITGEMFRMGAGLNVSHVPYKGTPEMVTDTMTGRIHYSFVPAGNVLPLVKDKKLIPLAVTTSVRFFALPEVPTVAESIIPGFEWDQWYGLFAPAKTPSAIVNQISRDLAHVLSLEEVRERLALRGSVPKPSTPEEFDKFVRNEVAKISKVIREGNIKIE